MFEYLQSSSFSYVLRHQYFVVYSSIPLVSSSIQTSSFVCFSGCFMYILINEWPILITFHMKEGEERLLRRMFILQAFLRFSEHFISFVTSRNSILLYQNAIDWYLIIMKYWNCFFFYKILSCSKMSSVTFHRIMRTWCCIHQIHLSHIALWTKFDINWE